jgi:hypothetical protein
MLLIWKLREDSKNMFNKIIKVIDYTLNNIIIQEVYISIHFRILYCVRFEVFTAVTVKNAAFWDVTPCSF